jgi:hypothetical protein
MQAFLEWTEGLRGSAETLECALSGGLGQQITQVPNLQSRTGAVCPNRAVQWAVGPVSSQRCIVTRWRRC